MVRSKQGNDWQQAYSFYRQMSDFSKSVGKAIEARCKKTPEI